MKFLCLAYGAEKDWKALTKQEQETLLAQDEMLRRRGVLMAAVQATATTASRRQRRVSLPTRRCRLRGFPSSKRPTSTR